VDTAVVLSPFLNNRGLQAVSDTLAEAGEPQLQIVSNKEEINRLGGFAGTPCSFRVVDEGIPLLNQFQGDEASDSGWQQQNDATPNAEDEANRKALQPWMHAKLFGFDLARGSATKWLVGSANATSAGLGAVKHRTSNSAVHNAEFVVELIGDNGAPTASELLEPSEDEEEQSFATLLETYAPSETETEPRGEGVRTVSPFCNGEWTVHGEKDDGQWTLSVELRNAEHVRSRLNITETVDIRPTTVGKQGWKEATPLFEEGRARLSWGVDGPTDITKILRIRSEALNDERCVIADLEGVGEYEHDRTSRLLLDSIDDRSEFFWSMVRLLFQAPNLETGALAESTLEESRARNESVSADRSFEPAVMEELVESFGKLALQADETDSSRERLERQVERIESLLKSAAPETDDENLRETVEQFRRQVWRPIREFVSR